MAVTVHVELNLYEGIFDPAIFDPAIFDTGWVSVQEHVLVADGLKWNRGIFDQGPTAIVARPGVLTFVLDNEPPDLPLGYYTPGNPNCRANFRHGTPVRIRLDDGTNYRYAWRGIIRSITPTPGAYGSRKTTCVAVDWMARLAEADASGLDLLIGAYSDAGLAAIVALADVAPASTDYDAGVYVFPFIFDDLGGGNPKALEVAQRLMQSEGGYLYVRGDTMNGEVLRMENGLARAVRASVASFTGADMQFADDGIIVPSTLDRVFNFVETVVYPRRRDDDNNTVLVQFDAPIEVPAGQTIRVFADYRDPAQKAEFVGGTDMQQPWSGYGSPAQGSPSEPTDYSANTLQDGTGSDITIDVGIVATYFGSRALFEITNSTGGTAWVRGPLTPGSPAVSAEGMQARGRGLYRYAPIIMQGSNAESIANYGVQALEEPLDLFYQNERSVGQDRADLVSFLYGGLTNVPTRVRILTEREELEAQGILRDIGDKITLQEDVTVPDAQDVFIQGLEQEYTIDGILLTWWTVGPADTSAALIFDDPDFGKFDERVFAYG